VREAAQDAAKPHVPSWTSGTSADLTVGFYADGRVGEIFVTMEKEGSIVVGLMDAMATVCSISMQYGVPMELFVVKLALTTLRAQSLIR
jgi:ribonucleoside-diphosphate reductase alpha chain